MDIGTFTFEGNEHDLDERDQVFGVLVVYLLEETLELLHLDAHVFLVVYSRDGLQTSQFQGHEADHEDHTLGVVTALVGVVSLYGYQ